MGLLSWTSLNWAYRREAGEPQITFNYVRALSDWLTNFTFSNGVTFKVPEKYQHTVPALLERVWAKDNNKQQILWEIGNQGSVQGDAFIKVAYDPPYTDVAGNPHRGKVRILPLNASFCLTEDTEVLTKRGWLYYNELTTDDEVLSLDPETDENKWTSVKAVNVFDWDGELSNWENERFSAISTPDHRWLYMDGRDKRSIKTTDSLHDSKHNGGRLVVAGGIPSGFSEESTWDNDFVAAVGWFITEGHWHKNGVPMLTQSFEVNPVKALQIQILSDRYGGSHYSHENKADQWYIPGLKDELFSVVGKDKRLTPEFLSSLTLEQAKILYQTLIDGDGHWRIDAHDGKTATWYQSHEGRVSDFQMLCSMLGYRTNARWRKRSIGKPCCDVTVYKTRTVNVTNLNRTKVSYRGKVWCPTTETSTWVARKDGITFVTGNCFPEWHPHDRSRLIRFKLKYRFWGTAPEGTRQVYTYVEILTDEVIEEYVNDELIDRRPNPLGFIPVVHIANKIASASPWGLSDITDVISLNRDFNEKATEISDIINYHTAPVTVITGASAANLEKSANKIWSLRQKDARVENLNADFSGLASAVEFLQMLKLGMHEMIGIPEAALGTAQAISNTSGVALAIQYMPTMHAYKQKKIQYEVGFRQISEMALKTLFLFEPDQLIYNPDTEGILETEEQPIILDPNDPEIYDITISWPPPLPVDQTIKLTEIQAKQALGLESNIGALRELGVEFPDEKFQEIFEEKLQDLEQESAMQIRKAMAAAYVTKLTGLVPEGYMEQDDEPKEGEPGKPPSAMDNVDTKSILPSVPTISDVTGLKNQNMMSSIATMAFGTKLPQRRNINNTNE